MPPRLTKARYLDGYRIVLTFEDGTRGILDMKDHRWRGVFEPLKKPEIFRSFKLDDELETIVWPTGADLAPEFLYEQATLPGHALRSTRRVAPRLKTPRPERRSRDKRAE